MEEQHKERIRLLLSKFLRGECTEKEELELAVWIKNFSNEDEVGEYLEEGWKEYSPDEILQEDRTNEILEKIFESKQIRRKQARSGRIFMRMVSIAAGIGILIFLSVSVFNKKMIQKNPKVAQAEEKQIIVPGGNKAILTLANGQSVALDSFQAADSKGSCGVKIIKVGNGVVKYEEGGVKTKKKRPVEYNTITTPRGGQYQVILADGSKIWLNAASSIKFPVTFNGGERDVFIRGEIYAEIAHDEKRPFKIRILSENGEDRGSVKVLGTTFNINAYEANHRVVTTLIRGSLAVERGVSSKLINPGEQGVIAREGIEVRDAENLEGIIAWKNGKFNFDGSDIREVMQQISSWYDVEVTYKRVPPVHFVGVISRGADVDSVLKLLELTGAVKFEIKDREITVM